MEKRCFEISAQDKEIVITRIRDFLGKLPDIEFAYVYGSFVMADKDKDIAVAVYLWEKSLPHPFRLNWAWRLSSLASSSIPQRYGC